MSRINHSCYPNAHLSWPNPGTTSADGRGSIIALTNIPEGIEIKVFYITDEGWMTTTERQDALQDYGFTCSCQVCSQQNNSSTARRTQLRDYYQEIQRWEGTAQVPSTWVRNVAMKYCNLFEEELGGVAEETDIPSIVQPKVLADA